MAISTRTLGLNFKISNLTRSSLWRLQKKGFNIRAFSSEISNQSRGGLPRFFSEVLPTDKGSCVRIQGDEFWHMTKVLRLTIDDKLELFDGKGRVVEGQIDSIDQAGVLFKALNSPKSVCHMHTNWHVFAAFGSLKGGRADWLVEKCTELGACSVTPLLTKHSHSISENRVERLQRVILAATKQCQRLHEMVLKPPVNVDKLLPIVAQSQLSFVAVAEGAPLFSILNKREKDANGIMIIGPEGDFTEKEVNAIIEAGAVSVGLGPHRLRVETATLALLTTLMLWSS